MRTLPLPLCLLLGATALAPVPGQDPAVALQSAGVTMHDGALVGLGPDYSARFAAEGVTFTPRLGVASERPATLHFALVEVRRGDRRLFTRTRDLAPTATGERVAYAHAPDLTEVYDVSPDGIEQSFVLARHPAGSGDLVVRGTITTDLPLAAANADGVRFERPGVGGVAFGAVTGIDANGARCRGALQCDGRTLELSLPASFVDSATYPLVLDPLIGSSFLIANIAGGSDVQPSIAFDETTQRYLVVWSVPMSVVTAEIRARFVNAAGFLGPQLLLSNVAKPGVRPAVANVNAYDQFAVSWVASGFPRLASVDAATGSVSPTATWIMLAASATGVSLGGDVRLGAAANRVLWAATTTGSLPNTSSAFLQLATVTGATPTLGGQLSLWQTQAVEVSAPAISRHCGTNGTWLTAFAFRDTTVPSPSSVIVYPVSAATPSGSICMPESWNWWGGTFPLHASVAIQADDSFLVAWQVTATAISMRQVYTPSCGSAPTLGSMFDPTGTPGPDDHPEVDWAGRYVLAWRHTNSTTPHAMVMAFLGTSAGGSYLAEGPTVATQYDPAVCTRWSGGDHSDEALVTWANAGIKGRLFEVSGTGTVTNLGGACGTTGFSDYATYSGTPIIGSTFAIDLLSPTAPVLALIVGFTQTPFACGPCTIVPSPDVMLAGGGPVSVAVPFDANLIGVELYTQWLQWRQAGCAVLPDFGFSNTLKFTVAE